MNYKIITDEHSLRNFIDWLPDIEYGECYFVMLMARKKYDTSGLLKSDKAQLKRFTSSKEFLFDKIKQLECEVGCYKTDGVAIPQETLALYITPNPRSYIKSSKNLVKRLLDLVLGDYNGYNPHQEALTEIQKSCSRTVRMDFDFDHCKIEDIHPLLDGKINMDAISFIETRGGFHMLVEVDKISTEYKKTYYNNICKLPFIDRQGVRLGLMPIPGCTQGGFTPKLKV